MNAIARPFGMLLMFLYTLVNNYGVAIIFMALIIKVILMPFQMKSKRGMIQQQRLQPMIAELQKKHGTNKAKINEETMKLYKAEGVSPASGCIWGFLPLPIMLALFQVIRRPITMMMGVAAEEYAMIVERLEGMPAAAAVLGDGYYVEIAQSQFISRSPDFNIFQQMSESLRRIDYGFLGLDFSITPQWDFLWKGESGLYNGSWLMGFVLFLIPLISGGMQFLATQLNKKTNPQQAALEGQAKSMNSVMMLMPLFSVYIGFITPAALGFYWTISTVFQIVQDVFLTKVYTKKIEEEEALKSEERRKKEAEIEAKRLETERKKAEGIVERNPNTSKSKKQKSEKQEQLERALEWQKKNAPPEKETKYEPSREGNRRYARGRAYIPGRYDTINEESELLEPEYPQDTPIYDSVDEDSMDAEDVEEPEEGEEGAESEDGEEVEDVEEVEDGDESEDGDEMDSEPDNIGRDE